MKLGHYNIKEGHIHLAAQGTFTALGLFSLMLLGAYFSQIQIQNERVQVAAVARAFTAALNITPPAMEAKAAIVYDARDGRVLYEMNPDEVLPLASLTKLMSAEAVLSMKAPDANISITTADLTLDDNGTDLHAGDTWSLKNLLTYGLIESSNDALAAVAASAGTTSIINKMNEQAKTLGLTDMSFSNPTGLDIDVEAGEAGAYGSARDVALLAADFLKRYPDFFEATVEPESSFDVNGTLVKAIPTAAPILDIPGLIGAKTGYTDLAGGNLVVAFDLEVGHPLIAVVLGSSYDGRFSDMRALIDATRAAASAKPQ